MIITFETPDGMKRADLNKSLRISIPLKHGSDNPNCYHAENPVFETIETENFIADVKRGGSVNYKKITITPHGNGTHTECYGHISADDAAISHILTTYHFLAELVSVELYETGGDKFVRFRDFIRKREYDFTEAVIIRTLPNPDSKAVCNHSGNNPPYFDPEILKYLCQNGVMHVLVDLPSLDPEEDGGNLRSHKEFWNIQGKVRKESTITELCFVPDDIEDGLYLLNLQTANMMIDATPSNPVIYKIY